MAKIKVLHFITELSIGGAQTALFRLLQGLQSSEQYDLSVICLYNGDKASAQQIRALGIPVTDLGMRKKWQIDAFTHLYQLLRQQRPDILHTWMFHANIPGRVIGKLAGIPHIISSERTMGQESNTRLTLNRWTARWADKIICNSQPGAVYAKGNIRLPAAKITVIPNGIDITQFANLPSKTQSRQRWDLSQNRQLVAAIGRPRPVKGYDLLLEAWVETVPAFPNATLVFVGDGPDVPALQQLAIKLKVSQNVGFLGDQQNIPQLLPAFNLLVSSSHHEGMPNVVLEAMAAGLPVAATAVGGTAEVVDDGITGLLVPASDPSALAQAITNLLTDPQQAQAMGIAGKQRIETHFNQTTTLQKTKDLYSSLLTSHS